MTSPGTFTYDDKGNTLTHVVGGVTTTYTWDHLNRMTDWAKTGETTQTYLYNADGMRVQVTPSGGTATEFVLDGREIAEAIMGGSITSYVGPRLISSISGTTRMIYHADGLGSTRAMTNGSEAVQEADIYDAYGNPQSGFVSASSFAFAGKYRYYADSTKLSYLKARYYDPILGRFISKDKIGYKGGLNLYAYASNEPVMHVDPTGLAPGDPGEPVWQNPSIPSNSDCDKNKCKKWCADRRREMNDKGWDAYGDCLAAAWSACSSLPWPADTTCLNIGYRACTAAYAGWLLGTELGYERCMNLCSTSGGVEK